MLRIAVYDGTREECDFIVEYVFIPFEGRQTAVHIDTYEKGGEPIEAGQEYDLYLLSVLMPGLTGIEATARLGEGSHVMVFITSSLGAAVDGHSVNTAGFILKPVERNRLEAVMECVVDQYLGEWEACMSVIHNRVPVCLKPGRTTWFENHLHRVFATLTGGKTLAIGQKLSELQEELGEHPQSLRCHQSYVVSLEQVERLEDPCFYIREGQLIPISGNFYKQSENVYYHHRLK